MTYNETTGKYDVKLDLMASNPQGEYALNQGHQPKYHFEKIEVYIDGDPINEFPEYEDLVYNDSIIIDLGSQFRPNTTHTVTYKYHYSDGNQVFESGFASKTLAIPYEPSTMDITLSEDYSSGTLNVINNGLSNFEDSANEANVILQINNGAKFVDGSNVIESKVDCGPSTISFEIDANSLGKGQEYTISAYAMQENQDGENELINVSETFEVSKKENVQATFNEITPSSNSAVINGEVNDPDNALTSTPELLIIDSHKNVVYRDAITLSGNSFSATVGNLNINETYIAKLQ
jgi:hypothetical protein